VSFAKVLRYPSLAIFIVHFSNISSSSRTTGSSNPSSATHHSVTRSGLESAVSFTYEKTKKRFKMLQIRGCLFWCVHCSAARSALAALLLLPTTLHFHMPLPFWHRCCCC
jgi:hypothetical protein